MKKYLFIFVSSLLAGMFIGCGVTVYLLFLQTSKLAGALLFGLGLFAIIHFGLYLYTGKVGYVLDNKPKYIIDLCVCLVGNMLGVFLLCSVLKLTRNYETLNAMAIPLVNAKQNDSWYSIFILAFMCGIMIYLAVEGHKICPYEFGKVIFAFVAIVVFILCSYEHCVANVGYYTYANIFNLKSLLYFIIMIIGNACGSIFIDGMIKICKYLKNN